MGGDSVVRPPAGGGDGLLLDGRVDGLEVVGGQVAPAADVPAVVLVVADERAAAHAFLGADVGVVEVGVEHDLSHREGNRGAGGIL